MVQPVQLAFQQQIAALKTQHDDFVSSLKQQQPPPQSAAVTQPLTSAEGDKPSPMNTQAGTKSTLGGNDHSHVKLFTT